MHRHLLGLTSPPADHVPDRSAMPMDLPEAWDGDVWVKSDGRSYFLRAWSVPTGRVAYGEAEQFRDAHVALLRDVVEGSRQVRVMIQQTRQA